MSDRNIPEFLGLFIDNDQLEMSRLLCVLASFSKLKKGLKLTAVTYYYAIAVSEFEFLRDQDDRDIRYNVVNLYIDFQSKVKQLIIELSNLDYIEVSGDIRTSINDIRIKLNPEGLKLVESLENEYFSNLSSRINFLKDKYTYSKKLENEFLSRGIL